MAGQDFRNVETALRLLRAYQVDVSVPVQDNPSWQAALADLVEGMTTHKQFEEEMGRVVQGLVVLANVFVDALVKNSNTNVNHVMELYERQTRQIIAELRDE
jgi:hypothetical protein